jgi:hypothetical protein
VEKTAEIKEKLEENETDAGAHQEPSDEALIEETGSNRENPTEPTIEELVRSEVERRVAEAFPARRESPRVETGHSHLSANDYLRLGYGMRSPHT